MLKKCKNGKICGDFGVISLNIAIFVQSKQTSIIFLPDFFFIWKTCGMGYGMKTKTFHFFFWSFSMCTQFYQLMCLYLHFGCIYLFKFVARFFSFLFDLIPSSSIALLFAFTRTRIVLRRRSETIINKHTYTHTHCHYSTGSNQFKDTVLNNWRKWFR